MTHIEGESNSKKIFIAKNGKRIGPFSILELQNSDIERDTLVWYKGLDNWTKISEIDELSYLIDQIPPPIPEFSNDINLNQQKNELESGEFRKLKNFDGELCDLNNIIYAVDLAYFARRFADAYYNCYELEQYKTAEIRKELANSIQRNLRNRSWKFKQQEYFNFPKNNIGEIRHAFHIPIEDYVLRFLFGYIRFKNYPNEEYGNFFGGSDNVFKLCVSSAYYKDFLSKFYEWQNTNCKRYSYVLFLDIKNFFNNINIEILLNEYLTSKYSMSDYYKNLFLDMFKSTQDNKFPLSLRINGLNCGSYVDDYYANIILQDLDREFIGFSGCEYGRLTDDIRIFFNEEKDKEDIEKKVRNCLSHYKLELNENKTRLLNNKIDGYNFEQNFFTHASTLVFIDKKTHETIEITDKEIDEIIDNDLTTDYLLSALDSCEPQVLPYYSIWIKHINNMEHIIKNVFNTQRYFDFSTSTFLKYGNKFALDLQGFDATIAVMGKIIRMLNDAELHSYIKYWLIRNFFLSDNEFFKNFYYAIDTDNRTRIGGYENTYFKDLVDALNKCSGSSSYILAETSTYIMSNKDKFLNFQELIEHFKNN